MASPVILLVQQRESAEMYAEYLRYHGLDVTTCTSVETAMKAAPAADVIVTGIALRGRTNGIDLIAQLRRRPETAFTPIVVLSACATTDYTRRATEAGCDIFLSKPCLPDVLLETVRRLVLRPNRRTPAKASLRKPGGAGANDGVRETRAADGKAGPVSKTRPV